MGYSELERVHTRAAVNQGAYIHVIKEERVRTIEKDMEDLSKC
jgi:hypothetical protein